MGDLKNEESERAQVLAALGGPETLLHGDLWPTNVIVLPDGDAVRVRLIDWDEAAAGPIGFDLSTFLLRFDPSHRRWILDIYRQAVDRLAGWELPRRARPEPDLRDRGLRAAREPARLERGRRRRRRIRLAARAAGRDGRLARRGQARAPAAMKCLIVNGDDFGASHGINLGVIEAHEQGNPDERQHDGGPARPARKQRASAHAIRASVSAFTWSSNRAPIPPPEAEIERQLARFIELTGRSPTHIDAHHNVHRDADLLPAFLAAAERHGLPLRGHCGVRHIATFYGQWDGETHPEQVGPDALARIVEAELEDGFNELCCHPGYVDGELASSYTRERETELETLCDPGTAALLSEQRIRLVTFREVPVR